MRRCLGSRCHSVTSGSQIASPPASNLALSLLSSALAMQFDIVAQCSVTRARVSRMKLAHGVTALPTFMPVATQAALKGLTQQQTEELCRTSGLPRNNTYHLNLRPGTKILDAAGGAHKFQGWRKNMLTVSYRLGRIVLMTMGGVGFGRLPNGQLEVAVTEEGVLFESPFTGEPTMLTPEESMAIQVCPSSLTTGARVEEAMWRSVRWLDRCIAVHNASGRADCQNLFAIIQGGLDHGLRDICLDEMIKRKDSIPGYAVGGLSGGEAKAKCYQPGPRYCMGIGFAEDLMVCVALGVDMADCVFPTRTARFGVALTFNGPINLRLGKHASSFVPIDDNCPCPTCASGTTRAQLHHIVTYETAGAHSVTLHNVAFQAQLMGRARDAILENRFPEYLKRFFYDYFGGRGWVDPSDEISSA
ncbi:queuine tRNA-ribosyltransferase [Rhizoctonia solani AG-1 IA]|uniref:Queuine tRNA-ribosyltransferase n=1 Tax=Thanatephorus cucumeris (strain AG1-IA) TaxID=983506 RepID=L8X0K8_THACA|nr:queuine tRNA-ribosyltransferase [Rhizoctonia solani AG-1 IA]